MGNIKNLKAENGVEKLKELVKAIDICLFCTNLDRNYRVTCRPMSAQAHYWTFLRLGEKPVCWNAVPA